MPNLLEYIDDEDDKIYAAQFYINDKWECRLIDFVDTTGTVWPVPNPGCVVQEVVGGFIEYTTVPI